MVTNAAARIRSFEISPSVFRTLAITAATGLWLIVVTGATVRLTGSGLGCESWPGCEAGRPFPENGNHSFIEFGNRLVGGLVIVATLVTALAAFRVHALPRWARWTAVGVFAGTLLQAPLGYLTVRFDLNPYLVMTHFLLSAVVLGAAVVLVVGALGTERGTVPSPVPKELRLAAIVAAAGCLILLVTGTVATAAGPHPGDSRKYHRLWRLQARRVRACGGNGDLRDLLRVHARLPRFAPLVGAAAPLARPRCARARRRPDPDRRGPVPHASALVARA